jgi:DNA-binding GntR family transcriptional regulator
MLLTVYDDSRLQMPDLERRTLAEQTYHTLRAAIMDDEYSPGAELQEVALARDYGVSRGPVREALRRLSAEGLVTIRPRRGAVVRRLTKKDFLDAYLVREQLEVLAVRLAASRLTAEDVEELSGHVDAMETAVASGDMPALFRENRAFHSLLVERADNGILRAAYGHVVDSMSRYWRRSVLLRGDLTRLAAEHRAILEAVRRGDADAAAALTQQHIQVPIRRVAELSEDDELSDDGQSAVPSRRMASRPS